MTVIWNTVPLNHLICIVFSSVDTRFRGKPIPVNLRRAKARDKVRGQAAGVIARSWARLYCKCICSLRSPWVNSWSPRRLSRCTDEVNGKSELSGEDGQFNTSSLVESKAHKQTKRWKDTKCPAKESILHHEGVDQKTPRNKGLIHTHRRQETGTGDHSDLSANDPLTPWIFMLSVCKFWLRILKMSPHHLPFKAYLLMHLHEQNKKTWASSVCCTSMTFMTSGKIKVFEMRRHFWKSSRKGSFLCTDKIGNTI